jgi:hypothetical protein
LIAAILAGVALAGDLYPHDDLLPLGAGIGSQVDGADVVGWSAESGYVFARERVVAEIEVQIDEGQTLSLDGVTVQLRRGTQVEVDGTPTPILLATVPEQAVDLAHFGLSTAPPDAPDAEARVGVAFSDHLPLTVDRRTGRSVPAEMRLRPGMERQPGVTVRAPDGRVGVLVGPEGDAWRIRESWTDPAPLPNPNQRVVTLPQVAAVGGGLLGVGWLVALGLRARRQPATQASPGGVEQ